MPLEVTKLIVQNCAVCASHLRDSTQLLQSSNKYDAFEIGYHACHTFYLTNQAVSAYKYALQAIDGAQKNDDHNKIKIIWYIKAKILFGKRLYKQALAEFLSLTREPDFYREIQCNIYANIGEIYLDQENYTLSLQYLTECVNKFSAINLFTLKNIYGNMASCYLFTKKVNEAKVYFQKSISISEQLKDTIGVATSYINIANQYYNQYEDALAISYFKEGLRLALLTTDYKLQQFAYYNMAVVFENKNNYKAALKYRKEYEILHDSIYNRDKVWSIAELKNKLDSQRNKQLVQSMQQTNDVQSLKLSKQSFQRNTFLISTIIFLSFALFAFYAYRQKSYQNKIIFAQREQLDALNHTKDQLFSVVAHDLRSPVQTLKVVLVNLQAALLENSVSKAVQVSGEIENIANSTYSLLNNLLYWALSQTGQLQFANHKLDIKRMIEQICYDYTSVAVTKQIILQNDVPDTIYCIGDLNTVKIIFRNLIDNAVKYSDNETVITISAIKMNDECIITVHNNGCAIAGEIVKALSNNDNKRLSNSETHSKSTGIGLWLVKTMVERNRGRLQIQTYTNSNSIMVFLPKYADHGQTEDINC